MPTDNHHALSDPGVFLNQVAHDVNIIGQLGSVPTILQTVAHTTGMRFTAVARVTETTWTACAVHDLIDFGLKPGGELVLESTICNEIRQHHQPVVFGHASAHPIFSQHHTPKQYGIESYISIPIFRLDGEFFGTLCAIDPLPANLDDPNIVKTLELFAKLIAAEIDVQERLERSASALLDAQETAKLREQFIAVLGHDLRSPLSAIQISADLLQTMEPTARAERVINHIQRSCDRMTEMVRNILDFARGRLGGGIPVALKVQGNLADALQHVIAEVQGSHPHRDIRVAMAIDHPVTVDAGRLAQLLANLLNNAVAHGAVDQPVSVAACCDGQGFELSVTNGGVPIAAEKLARLFQPFSREADAAPKPGLGLGLYIASEVAKAHQGTLGVSSTEAGTRFVFRMPLSPA
ncbi:GAF domain-containing sensor histidine kinase [Rhodanobacter sp. Col0626]|uniref:GAF domain-containing sensor histidine kinase n=1 Tax=Rhodanobacter sp. Col0626 TaxID=3415679 RepID=UPI003CF89A5E